MEGHVSALNALGLPLKLGPGPAVSDLRQRRSRKEQVEEQLPSRLGRPYLFLLVHLRQYLTVALAGPDLELCRSGTYVHLAG